MHQFTALVPSSSLFCSLLSVVPLVFPTSGLPSTPVSLVGSKQLPSPPASSPPQISPGTPLPIPRVSLAPRSQAPRTIHTFAPSRFPGAESRVGSEGGTSGGGRKAPASNHGGVSGVTGFSHTKRAPVASGSGVDDNSGELSELCCRRALATSGPGRGPE